MNTLLQELNNDRQRNYDDAKKDLLQAMYSFSKLDDMQKRQLVSEFLGAETLLALYNAMRQIYG